MATVLRILLLLTLLVLPLGVRAIRRIPSAIGRLSVWVLLACAFLGLVSYISHVVDTFFAYPERLELPLDSTTRNGTPYQHDTLSLRRENGHRVDIYVCEAELRRGWQQLSASPYDSLLSNCYTVGETVMRYLASAAHRRDSVGLTFLLPTDIRAIEEGVYNVHLVGRGPLYRYVWGELQGVEQYLLGDTAHQGELVRSYRRLSAGLHRLPSCAFPRGQTARTGVPLLSFSLTLGWVPTLAFLLLTLAVALWFCWRRAQTRWLYLWWAFLLILLLL